MLEEDGPYLFWSVTQKISTLHMCPNIGRWNTMTHSYSQGDLLIHIRGGLSYKL